MSKQVKTTAQVKKGAKNENKVINSNPGYIFRHLNKVAQGRDKDAKGVEGYSNENIKDLYSRLNAAFVEGAGFWWSSIYAFNGRPVTSLVAVNDSTAFYLDPSFTPDADHVLIHFAGTYYIGTLASCWSDNTVIDAAAARLGLVEKYATAIDKEQDKERKAKEKAERKAERKAKSQERKAQADKAKDFAKKAQELKKQVEAGTITEAEAAALLFAA